ncbi:MAG: class I SAM-dependent methyltransferase [Gemmataceae bacterium]
MLSRILEAEVMDTEADAADYDAMDFSSVNAAFAMDFIVPFSERRGSLIDIGTGTARIPIEIAKRLTDVRITAVDLSSSMLALAKRNVEQAGFADRIELKLVDAKGMPFPDRSFRAVVSNSIVHHIPEPMSFFREAVRLVEPGGLLFVRDLFRPHDRSTLDRLVETYAGQDTPHQRQLFADSLHAALTVDEVRAMVASLGFAPSTVHATSDRHWTWTART